MVVDSMYVTNAVCENYEVYHLNCSIVTDMLSKYHVHVMMGKVFSYSGELLLFKCTNDSTYSRVSSGSTAECSVVQCRCFVVLCMKCT